MIFFGHEIELLDNFWPPYLGEKGDLTGIFFYQRWESGRNQPFHQDMVAKNYRGVLSRGQKIS